MDNEFLSGLLCTIGFLLIVLLAMFAPMIAEHGFNVRKWFKE